MISVVLVHLGMYLSCFLFYFEKKNSAQLLLLYMNFNLNRFTGKRCHEKIDLCLSEPCAHGVCVDHLFNYECVCELGWTGRNCDIDINDCEENPCSNDGTCVDLIDGYKCNCQPGFEGKNCQHMTDDCKSEPCQNGATCIDELDGYVCKCRPGFVGLQCEGN